MKPILFLALIVSSILGVACGGGTAPSNSPSTSPTDSLANSAPTQIAAQPTNAPAPTNVPAPTVVTNNNPEPPSGDPFDIIKNASLAQLQAKSFRATTNIEAGDGKKTQLIIEYVSPDRVHVIFGEGKEQIAIKGKGAWSKNGDTWEAAPPGTDALFFKALSPEGIEETLKSVQVQSVKFIGPEILNGRPMFVYEYESILDLGNQSIKSHSKIWIGALDRRAYQIQAVSDSIVKPGTQSTTTATYEYDLPITIEAPL